MKALDIERHFPWYVDPTDTDNLDCQCGARCDGIAGWATHITQTLTGTTMKKTFEQFISVWSSRHLADDLGDKLRCEEADALIELFRLFDETDVADKWLAAHAVGDDCGDKHCTCFACNGGEIQ